MSRHLARRLVPISVVVWSLETPSDARSPRSRSSWQPMAPPGRWSGHGGSLRPRSAT